MNIYISSEGTAGKYQSLPVFFVVDNSHKSFFTDSDKIDPSIALSTTTLKSLKVLSDKSFRGIRLPDKPVT